MSVNNLTIQGLMVQGERHRADAIAIGSTASRPFVSLSLKIGDTKVSVFVPTEDLAWASRVAEAFNEPRPSETPESEEEAA